MGLRRASSSWSVPALTFIVVRAEASAGAHAIAHSLSPVLAIIILLLTVSTTSVEGFSTATPFPGRLRGRFWFDPRGVVRSGVETSTRPTKPVVVVGPWERPPLPPRASPLSRGFRTFVPGVDHFGPSFRSSIPVRTYVDEEVLVAGGRARSSVPAPSRWGDDESEPYHPFPFAPTWRSRGAPSEAAVVLLFQEPFLLEYRSPPRADYRGIGRPPPPTPAPTSSSPSSVAASFAPPPRTKDRGDVAVAFPPLLRDVPMPIMSPPPSTSGSSHQYRDVEGGSVWASESEEEELRWRHWLGRLVSHGRRKGRPNNERNRVPSDPATPGDRLDHVPDPDPFEDDPQLRVWVNLQRDWYRRMVDGDGGGRMTPRRARLLREAGLDLDLTRSRPQPRRVQLAPHDTGDRGDGGGGEEVGKAGTRDVGGARGGGTVRRRTDALDDQRTSAVAGRPRTDETGTEQSRQPRIVSRDRRCDGVNSHQREDWNGDEDFPRSHAGPGPPVPGRLNSVEELSDPKTAPSVGIGEDVTPSLDTRGMTPPNDVGCDRSTTTRHTPETKPRGRKGRRAARVPFSDRLSQLAAFRSEHGHLLVPRSHPTLGSFVNNARAQYRRMCDGKSSTMTPERISALEELGFRWRVGRNPDESWTRRLKELEAFSAKHGHCDVPHDCAENPSLGRWAARQRAQYRRLRRGEPSTLTRLGGRGGETSTTRLDDLEGLGFVWERRRGRGGDLSSSSVNEDHRPSRTAAVPNWKTKKKKGVRLVEVPPAPSRPVATSQRRRRVAAPTDCVEREAPRNLTVAC